MLDDGLADIAMDPAWLPDGWHVHYFARTTSTQDEARAAARAGAADRSLFVANFQSAGRGRQGRQWLAPTGTALMLSALFREQGPRPVPRRYTMLVSVALAEAIEEVTMLAPAIKWPNDLLLDGRKVAGVLAEAVWNGDALAVVVGCGTNVSLTAADLEHIGPNATSLRQVSGQIVDRGRLLAALVARLDAWLREPLPELNAAWHARLWGRGQRFRLRGVEGLAEDVEQEVLVLGADPDGALRVRLANGAEVRTLAGEIIL